jgi:hypothetical protein
MYHCTTCFKEISNELVNDQEFDFICVKNVQKIVYKQKCECGGEMKAGFAPERRFAVCGAHGDFNLISDSLAVPVQQIAEHRQTFPDIEVRSDGRPHFKSIKQYDRYLKQTGFKRQSHGKITGP